MSWKSYGSCVSCRELPEPPKVAYGAAHLVPPPKLILGGGRRAEQGPTYELISGSPIMLRAPGSAGELRRMHGSARYCR
jgi:hypothetical protein